MNLAEEVAVVSRRETAEIDLGVWMGEVHEVFVFERDTQDSLAVQPDFLTV